MHNVKRTSLRCRHITPALFSPVNDLLNSLKRIQSKQSLAEHLMRLEMQMAGYASHSIKHLLILNGGNCDGISVQLIYFVLTVCATSSK